MSVIEANSTLRAQATDALCRARALPVGSPDRNGLRQLAIGLRWLERNGPDAARVRVADGFTAGDRRPADH